MGLFGKIKDILFEEEEVGETSEPKKERQEEVKVKEEPRVEVKKVEMPKEIRNERPVQDERPTTREEFLGERDFLKQDQETSSPFLDFDEAEFASMLSRPEPRKTNVLEYEKRKKIEKRTDYGHYEKAETRETVEKKKFKPSPIISPVYGILNEDYRIEDIKDKSDVIEPLDIDSVRKKAFEVPKKEEPRVDLYEEETVTVKYAEDENEKIKKEKTIDDLLEDTSDEIIDTRTTKNNEKSIEYDDDLNEDFDLDTFEEIPEKQEEVKKEEPIDLEDTVESDLFDLIDSMYENREDGE